MKKLAIFGILIFLAACDKQEALSPNENTDIQLAHRVSIFESKDSQKQWFLTAEAVDFSGLTVATLKNPQLLLKQNGQDSALVAGKEGLFDYPNKRITIRGNAKINSLTEKVIISTERFFYEISVDRVWSDTKTTITRGTAKAVAHDGIETDSKLTKIELKKQTTQVPQDIKELTK